MPMGTRSTKLMIFFAVSVAYVVPAGAQTLKKEPDTNKLSCGQKVLVENNTCPADQILEVTGSCLNAIPSIDVVQMPRGRQYHCVKRIQD